MLITGPDTDNSRLKLTDDVVGGSPVINGMCYICGHSEDYAALLRTPSLDSPSSFPFQIAQPNAPTFFFFGRSTRRLTGREWTSVTSCALSRHRQEAVQPKRWDAGRSDSG